MEYRDLFGGPDDIIHIGGPVKSDIFEVSPEAAEQLHRAMVLVCQRWKEFADGNTNGFVHPDITDGTAALAFVRSRYMGVEYPRYMSLAFNPEQLRTVGDKGSLVDTLEAVAAGDLPLAKSLLWVMQDADVTFGKMIKVGAMALHGRRMPLDFPAMTACKLYNRYCPVGGSVLDPCHGWSGRFVGFLLSDRAMHYVGIDPSPVAHRGIIRAAKLLAPLAQPGKTWQFRPEPFENSGVHERFDMALTSPPYYDVESYDGDDQSFRRYATFDEWVDEFYVPLICKTAEHLKPGGHFLLNVGSQSYPLVELAREIAPCAGLTLIRSESHIVKQNAQANTSAERGESLLIFRLDV